MWIPSNGGACRILISVHKAFRSCPRCKEKLTHQRHEYLQCSSCSFQFYLNPAPCVAVILNNEKGDLLLVQRARSPKKGYWDLPGGFMAQGESAEVALRREVKEELGVTTKHVTYQGSYPDRYRYKTVNYHVVTFVYTGILASEKKIVAADDVSAFHWFHRTNLPWSTIAFPSLQKALKDYCAL